MTPTANHNQLSAEDSATTRRFIEKQPAIYQRWLARHLATKAKQAEASQRIYRNKP